MRPLIKGFCARSFMKGRIDLTFISEPHEGAASIAKPLLFEKVPDELIASVSMPTTVSLRPDEAQHLMDELWRCGIRPTEGQGSAGSLAATQDHLKDMQRIAFALLRDEQFVADTMRERGATVMERDRCVVPRGVKPTDPMCAYNTPGCTYHHRGEPV